MRRTNCVVACVGAAAGVTLLATAVSGPASAGDAEAAQRTCRGVPATLVGSGRLEGTPGRDVIVATAPNTRVLAGAGDDLVCGSRLVRGEAGDDEIHYSGGATLDARLFVLGGPGDDTIEFHGAQHHASRGSRDGVYGGAGADVIVGAGGSLWFTGGSGPDRLVSGPGGDILEGGPGNDVLLGGRGQDIATGGRGNDRLRGGGASDDLSGGAGRDEVWGGPAWDVCARGNEVEHSCEADGWVQDAVVTRTHVAR